MLRNLFKFVRKPAAINPSATMAVMDNPKLSSKPTPKEQDEMERLKAEYIEQTNRAQRERHPNETLQSSYLRGILKDKRRYEQVLQSVKQLFPESEHSTQKNIMQLKFLERIHMLCVFDTDDPVRMQRHMSPVLRLYNDASLSNCMHMFHNSASIFTYIAYRNPNDYQDIANFLNADARDVAAYQMSVANYRNGIIVFKCNPLTMANVVNSLRSKGYFILGTELELKTKDPIELEAHEMRYYKPFLQRVLTVPQVEYVYDNVRFPLITTSQADD